jgi:asparagine synthase (glutamine-hydrolysing)
LVYRYPLDEDNEPPDTAKLARLHRAAIQRRISGCDGFGLFLSGGLDSSLNVAVAAELSVKRVKTFSATFDVAEFDESSDARLVATKYNTEHFELRLDTAGCLDRLPEMVWAMQEPIIDYSYIPTFYVAEAIKKQVDVAIGGDGPDQFLGEHYAYAAWYDLLTRIPFALSAAAWSVRVNKSGANVRHGFWQYVRRKRLGRQIWQSLACAGAPCGSGVLNSFCSRLWGDLPPNDLVRLLSPELLRRVSVPAYNREWIERWQMHQASNSQNNFILADTSHAGLCGSFAKVGAMCSAHNLIIDEPYLDKPLLRYFYGLKDSWRVDGSWSKRLTRTIPTSETKRILRQVAMRYLPEELVLHKAKHGFGLPLIRCWQEYTSGVSARQIFGALLSNTDWLDHKYLDRLVQEQASGVRNHRYMLLLLAALDQWFRIFVQGRAEQPTWRWSNCF